MSKMKISSDSTSLNPKKWIFNEYLNESPWQPEKFFWKRKYGRSLMNFYSKITFSGYQDDSLKYPYDYIWSDNFFDQKSGKIGRNSKILSKSS